MTWDSETDFVVIGSGAAGLMAALSATSMGRSAIVLEKSAKIGGTTAFSGALLWVPMNPKGAKVGFADDRREAIDYIRATTGGPADIELIEAFVDAAAETVRFIEASSGVKLINTPYPDSFVEVRGGVAIGRHLEPDYFPLRSLGAWRDKVRPAPRPSLLTTKRLLEQGSLAKLKRIIRKNLPWLMLRMFMHRRSGGNALIGGLLKGCLDKDVCFHLDTRVTRLVQDDTGRVVGVECLTKTGTWRLRARQAVVLANGGFEHNKELVAAFLPLELDRLPSPPDLAAGDNIAFAR